MISMSENNMTNKPPTKEPTKQNITLRLTTFATNRLIHLADSMGLSKSSYVEMFIRQTKLGDEGKQIGGLNGKTND